MFKGHKIWRLAVAGIAVAVVLALAGMGVASFLFNQQNAATVTVKGGGFSLFKDAACTQPLTAVEALNFGDIRQDGQSTNTVAIWGKNVGTDGLKPTLKVNGLNALLRLEDPTWGIFNGTPKNLYTPAVGAHWTDTTFTSGSGILTSGSAITAAQTSFSLSNGGDWSGLVPLPAFPSYARFADNGEIIKIVSVAGLVVTIERAQFGTAAAAHPAANPTCRLGTWSADVPEVLLAAGAILPLSLHLDTTGNVSALLGQTLAGWNIEINVTSNY